MRRSVVYILAVLGSGILGCSLLLDPEQFRGGGDGLLDGGIDASSDAEPIDYDAGPVEPAEVFEGEGSGTGAPPLVVVLRGDFSPDTQIQVGDPDLTVEPAVVATDGSMAAVAVRFPVDTDLADGETVELPITIIQDSTPSSFDVVRVNGLAEAMLTGELEVTDGIARYSKIEVVGPVVVKGASSARLWSMSDVIVADVVDASGGPGTAAGPGGHTGGGGGTGGMNAPHGGGAGASGLVGEGGGGAGHAASGGAGAGGATAGQESGSDELLPLSDEGGHGGGSGGDGTLGMPGAGGGGGGIVELFARGTASLGALINVDGGAGSNSTGGVVGVSAAGSGGGGSGGALLIRAIDVTDQGGTLNARGGSPGTRQSAGGDGADGRIRIDSGTIALPAITSEPPFVRGPQWAADTPYLVTNGNLDATFYGEANRTYGVSLNGGSIIEETTDVSGQGTSILELARGLNELCIYIDPESNLTNLPEAKNCYLVAYIP